MKKLLFLLLTVTTFIGCEKEPITPDYSIEGKWLWSPSQNRADANTMYEFTNGFRYTYYSLDGNFDSLDSTDRIPGSETYTFDGDSLVIDGIGYKVTFECDGGKVLFSNGTKLWKLTSNCQ